MREWGRVVAREPNGSPVPKAGLGGKAPREAVPSLSPRTESGRFCTAPMIRANPDDGASIMGLHLLELPSEGFFFGWLLWLTFYSESNPKQFPLQQVPQLLALEPMPGHS